MKKLQIILWGMLFICCPMQAQIHGCEYEVAGNAFYVETGDVNGDGFPDLVIGHANNPFLPTQQNDVKQLLELSAISNRCITNLQCATSFNFLLRPNVMKSSRFIRKGIKRKRLS